MARERFRRARTGVGPRRDRRSGGIDEAASEGGCHAERCLLVDEAATPALGLTPGPTAFPWQTHARGLAGHLAYGVATETALDVLDRAA